MNITSLDLNLLYIFDNLFKTRSVSNSARQLGLSQPALSNALARLRRTLDDDLFLRSKSGMIPTIKSNEIHPIIREILENIEFQILKSRSFDFKTSSKTFHLCATDNELLTYINHFICNKEIAKTQLKFKLSFPKEFDFFQNMENLIVDLSFGVDIPRRSNFEYEHIYSQKYVCLSKSKLSASYGISLKKYLSLDHILVSPLGGATGPVDLKLQEIGLKRNISLIVPSFSLLPQYLSNREFIVTLPELIAKEFSEKYKFNLYKLPFELEEINMQMVWHKSLSNDESHIWLRSKIKESINSEFKKKKI